MIYIFFSRDEAKPKFSSGTLTKSAGAAERQLPVISLVWLPTLPGAAIVFLPVFGVPPHLLLPTPHSRHNKAPSSCWLGCRGAAVRGGLPAPTVIPSRWYPAPDAHSWMVVLRYQ